MNNEYEDCMELLLRSMLIAVGGTSFIAACAWIVIVWADIGRILCA